MNADMVLVKGHIITLNRKKPGAQAIAIKDGGILQVGTNKEIDKLIGKNTKTIDLDGKTVVPGLIDAHVHMIALGHTFPYIDLRGVSSIKKIQEKLQAKVRTAKKGEWILGRGWDQDRLREKRLPTRWDLDKVSPVNPVHFKRVCGHIGVANSKALETAGINKKTAASWGNLVDRDPETGELTGILRENADDMIGNLPEPSGDEMLKACSSACSEAYKVGLTSVHWLVSKPNEVYALQSLREQGRLPIRVNLIIPVECVEDFRGKAFNDSFLRLGCVKIFTDGSLGARTAALREPYSDDSSTKGILCYSTEQLQKMIKTANDAGFQVAVHAIGDLAVSQTIDAFERSLDKETIKKARHRIEHVSVLTPELIERIKQLGLQVCVQPHFVVSDFWIGNRLGKKRARWTYAFKALKDHGVPLAASSDAPAEPLSPLLGVWAAAARESFPEERLTVEEALEAYTLNAAFLSFEENAKGSIEVGKFADFTVLSRNPLNVRPERIRDIKVVMAIVAGRVVYSAMKS